MPVTLNQQLFSIGKARRELIPLAPSGKPISPATVWRWSTKGLRTPSGDLVRLRVVKVGGRPYVSREAIEEFFTALSEPRQAPLESSVRSDRTASQLRDADLL